MADLLELNVSQQRLDSTHVFSHMATFGRVKLMAVAIKRCLTQVKRHAPDDDSALPDELRVCYAPSEGQLFAAARDAAARERSKQQVAEDLLLLIERFADRSGINGRTSYTSLVTIFQQQCEVVERRVVVIAKTGGDVIQNPSDLGVTTDTANGSDENVLLAESFGVELISPVPGRAPHVDP